MKFIAADSRYDKIIKVLWFTNFKDNLLWFTNQCVAFKIWTEISHIQNILMNYNTFVKNSSKWMIYVADKVSQYLSCSCESDNVGRTLMSLGPLWAGPLGSVSFINSLLPHVKHLLQLSSSLLELITELRLLRILNQEF